MNRPFAMLVVLDGWGWRDPAPDNAITCARKPNFDRLWASCPHAFLTTHGLDVGLPAGQMGNSEVGHMNIGAGRVMMQDLPRIDAAIADGSLAASKELAAFVSALRASGGTAHLMGLVSPGGVHSHQDQAVALAKILAARGLKVAIHAFLDGRDTPPSSAPGFVANFTAALPAGASIATVIGRYFAMDRDKRWDRVERAYAAMAQAKGERAPDAAAAIEAAHAGGHTDEFVPPAVIDGYAGMRAGDGILCFNFRADRVREILAALLDPGFDGFARERIEFAAALGMTRYSDALAKLMPNLFPPQSMANLLGGVVADAGLTQLRMAETEKYPHVTYFLNGGREEPFPGEERILIPSPKVATYDLQPEMSAVALGDAAIAAIASGRHNLIVLNFANPDMVGHTGVLAAAIKAVETVDAQLGRIAEAVAAAGGVLLVTADHGNCEQMLDPATGGPHTAHTINRVPVLLAGRHGLALHDGRLADVAPTLLKLLGLARPAEMTGHSLV